jgi:putative ABC transport system permease protein
MSRTQRIVRDVLAGLLANKQRAVLMMMGIAVGTAVLSGVIAVAQGTSARVMELVQHHNLDMIMVRAGGEVQVFAPQTDRGLVTLMPDDARAIEAEIPNVEMVSVVQAQRGVDVTFEDRATTTRVFGVDPTFSELRYRPLVEGEFISGADMSAMARVAWLGDKVAKDLFPQGGAVGSTIRVDGDPYTVRGVFAPVGMAADGQENQDDRLVMPYTTSARRLLNRPYVEQIVVRVADLDRLPETAEHIRALLRVRHNIDNERDDFFVREPEDVIDAAFEAPRILFAVMAAVSLVALIGGGIVIMNLMLVAVLQRTREIGLRRAIGAHVSDITRQFQFEALFVSLAGGIVGVILGLGGALSLQAAGMAASRITAWPFVLALVASIVLGLAFGAYPARKAASIDPAASLRGRPG